MLRYCQLISWWSAHAALPYTVTVSLTDTPGCQTPSLYIHFSTCPSTSHSHLPHTHTHAHTLRLTDRPHIYTHTCRGLVSSLQCMWQWILGWESGIRFPQCRAEGCMGTCIDTADSFRRGNPHRRSAGYLTHTYTVAWFTINVLCVFLSSCHKVCVKWRKVRQTKGLVTRIQLEFIKGTF